MAQGVFLHALQNDIENHPDFPYFDRIKRSNDDVILTLFKEGDQRASNNRSSDFGPNKFGGWTYI